MKTSLQEEYFGILGTSPPSSYPTPPMLSAGTFIYLNVNIQAVRDFPPFCSRGGLVMGFESHLSIDKHVKGSWGIGKFRHSQ